MQHALTAEVTLRVCRRLDAAGAGAGAASARARAHNRIRVLLVSRVCGVCAKLG